MVRVLCTGDIHIGRPISGIPNEAAIGQIKTASAWEAIVDLALSECPDLVAISGDIIDEKNKYFEAVGPVERGLTKLRNSGIAVVAVAGNHDWEVLPVIARANPGLIHLIGLNQQWERKTIDRDGQPLIHVDGWSFSSRHTAVDPLDSYRAEHPGTAPVLGLVHVDLDATERKYAPTSRWKLQQQPVDAWLIGHIHVPLLIENTPSPPILYPGSPFAIDPGETGMHGAWMLHFDGGHPPRFEFFQLSPVQFGMIDIDVTGGTYEADVLEQIERAVRDHLDAVEKAKCLELLLLRVTLIGVLPAGLSLADIVQRIPE
ncbi:MAG: metallophosphoesterase family protein, partial [Thermomicrobiales bacterium]